MVARYCRRFCSQTRRNLSRRSENHETPTLRSVTRALFCLFVPCINMLQRLFRGYLGEKVRMSAPIPDSANSHGTDFQINRFDSSNLHTCQCTCSLKKVEIFVEETLNLEVPSQIFNIRLVHRCRNSVSFCVCVGEG